MAHLAGSALVHRRIQVYQSILSGGEITSPAENVQVQLMGMYLQRRSPNTNAFSG